MAKISGTLSNNARIIIINENSWSVESNTVELPGPFQITNLVAGKKTIIARSDSGKCLGYGNVDTI